MQVDFGGVQGCVPEKLLNRAYRNTMLKQVRAVAMAQRVNRGVLLQANFSARSLERFLQRRWVHRREPIGGHEQVLRRGLRTLEFPIATQSCEQRSREWHAAIFCALGIAQPNHESLNYRCLWMRAVVPRPVADRAHKCL